jgi:two-component SAPR family response regulator
MALRNNVLLLHVALEAAESSQTALLSKAQDAQVVCNAAMDAATVCKAALDANPDSKSAHHALIASVVALGAATDAQSATFRKAQEAAVTFKVTLRETKVSQDALCTQTLLREAAWANRAP